MPRLVLATLLVALASGARITSENEKLKFDVVSSRSIEEPPTMKVTFHNGLEDDLELTHYKMNKAAPIGCNYIGRLRGDPTSSVAVSGCLNKPEDRLQVTLHSKNNFNKMFKVDSFGNAEIVRSPFQDGAKSVMMRKESEKKVDDNGWHNEGGDEEVNDEMEQFVSSIGTLDTLPTKLEATVKFGYDDGALAQLDGEDFDSYIQGVMVHVQSYYQHSDSLGTEIHFEVVDGSLYEDTNGAGYTADDNIYEVKDWTADAVSSGVSADTFTWVVANGGGSIAGIAWLGTMCYEPYNTNLNELQDNELRTAYVVAHEMGHNFGMYHDFDDSHGGYGGECDGTGIMSYGDYTFWETTSTWSTCSKSDFEYHYTAYSWGNTCLDDISDEEDSTTEDDSTVATTEDDSAASTTEDTSTGETNYYVDDGCHSENNTPDDVVGFYQSESSTAFVRCCSTDAAGSIDCDTVSNCRDSSDLVTYADAETECAAKGMTVCTKDELLSDICCGTGGNCDSAAVWTSTPEEVEYYVDDGCHSENSTPDDVVGFYQSEDATAYIRCCSTDGTTCSTESNCQNTNDLVTYADAETECAANGMRLCTKDELLTDICCGTGGQCDSYAVWTSTTA